VSKLEVVAAMDKIIKLAAEYLKARRAYRSTLNKFQAFHIRLADMLTELELACSIGNSEEEKRHTQGNR